MYNTVGEITGSEKPDEFVVVGAHLDSWDLGTGATDNGTGSCVVLEVARVLGVRKDRRAVPRLLEAVADGGPHRSFYIRMLGDIGDPLVSGRIAQRRGDELEPSPHDIGVDATLRSEQAIKRRSGHAERAA